MIYLQQIEFQFSNKTLLGIAIKYNIGKTMVDLNQQSLPGVIIYRLICSLTFHLREFQTNTFVRHTPFPPRIRLPNKGRN